MIPGRSAEGKGFEPLVRGYRTMVFKTISFGHSDNPPTSLEFIACFRQLCIRVSLGVCVLIVK